jgi:hypothetical protein
MNVNAEHTRSIWNAPGLPATSLRPAELLQEQAGEHRIGFGDSNRVL